MPFVIAVLVFFSMLALLLGLYAVGRGQRAAIENRLQRVVIEPIRREEQMDLAFVSNIDRKRRKQREAKGLKRYVTRLEDKLVKAGVLLRAQEFAIFAGGLTVLVAVIVYLMTGATGHVLLVLLAGLVIPYIVIDARIQGRGRILNSQVADMILLMANGLKAGHSLVQVMEGVSREVGPPLSDHLKTFLRDMVMGVSMEDALVKLEAGADDEDLSMVITAILIQYQVGGNLAEILDNISVTIQERVRIKQEIRTLTAQGRVSAIVICLLPVAVAAFIVLTNPDFIMVLFQESLGLMMVGAAVFFELLGILFVRRIVEIKV